MRRLAAVLVIGALVVAGCGSSRLTHEQAKSLCTALGTANWATAENRAMEFGLDHVKAEEAVRAAVRNSCPELQYKVDV